MTHFKSLVLMASVSKHTTNPQIKSVYYRQWPDNTCRVVYMPLGSWVLLRYWDEYAYLPPKHKDKKTQHRNRME